jgi:general secretion pathway protein D
LDLRLALAAALGAALAGCAFAPGGDSGAMPPPLARLASAAEGGQGARRQLALGMRELYDGRLDEAASHFNRGLKLDPQNANLNFLNALVYDVRANGGDRAQADLAEVGYRLALRFDPDHWLAACQLGDLYWRSRRYADAQDAFARALLAEPDSVRAAYGLAAASYAAGDPVTARVALERLPAAAAGRTEALRTRALVNAALGEDGAARALVRAYRAGGAPSEQAEHALRRVRAWAAAYGRGEQLAQQSEFPVSPYTDRPDPSTRAVPPNPPAPGPGTAPGAAPRNAGAGMVILDAVIIEREESTSTSSGVNLLAGLSLQFGGNVLDYSRTRTHDLISGDTTFNEERRNALTVTLPAVTYSLNIANAQDSSNRIVARPSVLAYDRTPSEMFIGSELTFTAQGAYGAASSFSKEVGLTLQVTPRVEPGGRLKLAVRTEFGTFAPTAAPGTFKESLATVKSRSSVNAEMAIGQTVVIAAGSESRESSLRDGVPVLRDIPLLQYLFSTKNRVAQETSLLILITPRLPADRQPAAGEAPASAALGELKRRHGAWWTPTSNVLKAMQRLRGIPVYEEFRRGDVRLVDLDDADEPLSTPGGGRVRRLLRDMLQLIYF